MKFKLVWPSKQWFVKRLIGALLFLAAVWTIPHRWCALEAPAWFRGDVKLQSRLARGVESAITEELSQEQFATGDARFNGEWLFLTYMMAGMGFGQTAVEHSELRERHVELMNLCLDRLLSPQFREFDREAWGKNPINSLDTEDGHAAYLGYLNLLLSYHRTLVPDSKFAAINDQITETLIRRIEKSPTRLLQTYPGESYPVDNSAVIASIALHGQATSKNHQAVIDDWVKHCREQFIDAKTGLLYQSVDWKSGFRVDAPRGSGTGLAVYFLSFADKSLSQDLFQAMRETLADSVIGFGTIREYPPTVTAQSGDVDSGPVLFGHSTSATGFGLAASRIHGDEQLFSKLYSTACLFGGPTDIGDQRKFITGGLIGDAVMFAMLTAQPLKIERTES